MMGKRKNAEADRCQKMSEGKSLFSWIVTDMVWVGCAFVFVSRLLQGMEYNVCKALDEIGTGHCISFPRNIGKAKMWRWLSNRSEMVSIEKLWSKNMRNSISKSFVIHIDQQKAPGVAWKERRVWCKGKHWPIFAIGCHLRRSKRKLEELKKVGLKFLFWKARISFTLGEMPLRKSLWQEKSNTIKKTENLKIENQM